MVLGCYDCKIMTFRHDCQMSTAANRNTNVGLDLKKMPRFELNEIVGLRKLLVGTLINEHLKTDVKNNLRKSCMF